MSAFPLGEPEDGVERALKILDDQDLSVPTADEYNEMDRVAREERQWIQDEFTRVDGNTALLEKAIAKEPVVTYRTGSSARIDPDDIRLFWVALGLTGAFALAAFGASFSGQLAMAQNTFLPVHLHFLVPLFIDLPIVVVSLAILIFRRRRESTLSSWILLGLLTAASAAINAVHVLDQAGVLRGAAPTLPVLLGTGVMASAPVLVLLSWEQLARLAVKPLPEKE